MSSTVLQLVTPVIRELGEDIDDAATQQQFVDWTAEALSELYEESVDWPFLRGSQSFSTSAGVATYPLGTLVAEVISVVRDTNNVSLPATTVLELGRRGYDIDEAGSPTHYIVDSWSAANGLSIRLWPVPTTEETILIYRTTDPAAATATTVVDVPNAFFVAVRHLVRASYFLSVENLELSDRYRSAYSSVMIKLRRRFAYTRGMSRVLGVWDIPRGDGRFHDAQLPVDFARG